MDHASLQDQKSDIFGFDSTGVSSGLPASCEILAGVHVAKDGLFLAGALTVEGAKVEEPWQEVLGPTFTFCMSTSDVVQATNKSRDLSAGYLDIFNLSLSRQEATALKLSESQVAVIFSGIKYNRRAFVSLSQNMALRDEAKTKLDQDFDDFLESYGHGYVRALYYGASVDWAVVFTASSSTRIQSLKESEELHALMRNLSAGLSIANECKKIESSLSISISVRKFDQGVLYVGQSKLLPPTKIEDLPSYIQNFSIAEVGSKAGESVPINYEYQPYSAFSTMPAEAKYKLVKIHENLKTLYARKSTPDDEFSWTDFLYMLDDRLNQHEKCLACYKLYGQNYVEAINASKLRIDKDIEMISKKIAAFKLAILEPVPAPSCDLFESMKEASPEVKIEHQSYQIGSGPGGAQWDGADATGSAEQMIATGDYITSITLAPGKWELSSEEGVSQSTTKVLLGGIKYSTSKGKQVSHGQDAGKKDWPWGAPVRFTGQYPPLMVSLKGKTGVFVDRLEFTFDCYGKLNPLSEGGDGGSLCEYPISKDDHYVLIGLSGRAGYFIDSLVVSVVRLLDPF